MLPPTPPPPPSPLGGGLGGCPETSPPREGGMTLHALPLLSIAPHPSSPPPSLIPRIPCYNEQWVDDVLGLPSQVFTTYVPESDYFLSLTRKLFHVLSLQLVVNPRNTQKRPTRTCLSSDTLFCIHLGLQPFSDLTHRFKKLKIKVQYAWHLRFFFAETVFCDVAFFKNL